ncbi:MAG: serine hydrolase domain-containing protein [Blastocatellia bacterium]|nr:serine hydrolase domain-containing protein [Blastocatellia bacterium]
MNTAAALLALTILTISSLAQARSPHEREAQVDRLFAQWNKPDSPGAALAVIQDGAVIYKRGYGQANLEFGIPNAPDTAFYLCSTSKQFTAMAIALLEEQGRLRLEDDIRRYLPEMPQYPHPITIRHLIHHTSGLREYFTLWGLAGRNAADSISEEENLLMLSRQKALNFAPGEQYSYNNSGYFLLAMIVKRASGRSLRDFAAEQIFKPLGMNNTQYQDDRTLLIPRRADSYLPRAGGGFALGKTNFDLVGSGGIYTTVEDLARWDQNFYRNRLGRGGPALIERVLTKSRLNDGQAHFYAFGLGVNQYRGETVHDHSGSFLGYRTELLRFPAHRFSVIVLSNVSTAAADGLARAVADIYLAEKFKPDGATTGPGAAAGAAALPAGPSAPPVLTADQLREFTGEFVSDELDAVWSLRMEQGQLAARIRRAQARTFRPIGEDRFSAPGLTLQFRRDAQRRILGFVVEAGRVKGVEFVKKTDASR